MSTKIDEILRTKKESGLEQFERLRTEQEKRSARAARTATLSRRTEDAPLDHTRRVVRVTAVERQGHSGFFRAGQFWPSGDGRVALVTGRMFDALKSEPNLRVEVDPTDAPTFGDEVEPIDVPLRESIDLSSTLLTPAPGAAQGVSADAIRAAFEAGKESAAKDAEIAQMRARIAELEAKAGGAQPPPAAPAAPPGDDDGKKGGRSK